MDRKKGRPYLPLGTFGNIKVTGDAPPYKARARFRDYDGVTRPVARFGTTKAKAETALREALRDRQTSAPDADVAVTAQTTVRALAKAWLAAEHDWSDGTRETYEYHVKHVERALGDVRVGELRLVVVNRALRAIRESAGPGAAKTVKTVLRGMCDHAISYEAIDTNPMVGATHISRKARKEAVRSLDRDEEADLLAQFYADERANETLDLAELVDWMLLTGARIGESCAARDAVLDLRITPELTAGTWEINATAKRLRGRGLHVQTRTKTDAGWRAIALPSKAVRIAAARLEEPRWRMEPQVLFPAAARRNLRDPSNTQGDLRECLNRFGYPWVTSHVFRKTTATRLDEAGFPARVIADILGHAKPSMTQDVYLGRNVVSAEAAEALDR